VEEKYEKQNLEWAKAEQYHRNNHIPQNDMVSSVSSLDSECKPEYQKDKNAKESTVTDGRSQEINPTFPTRRMLYLDNSSRTMIAGKVSTRWI